jgi:hypothetical protein
LLDDVRQFVGEQALTLSGVRRELPGRERDVVSHGKGSGADVSRRLLGA